MTYDISVGPKSTPGYVSGVKNSYNSLSNAYNWKASNTRRIRASLIAAEAGTGVANHVFIGESTAAGVSGETTALQTWPVMYRNAFGIPIGGTGMVPAINGNPSSDSRWTATIGTGGWSTLAYVLYTSTSGVTATFTSERAGTVVKVYYFGNSSGMTVSIDGKTAVALTMDATQHAKVYTVTGLANTTHTVLVTTTTSSYNALIGASVGGANGLVTHNLGVGGSVASSAGAFTSAWETTTPGYILNTLAGAVLADGITPDVVYCQLGINDHAQSYAESASITALTNIRNQFPNSDFVLVGEYQPTGPLYAGWAAWTQRLFALADALDVPFVDYYDRSGGYTVASANGLMADSFHPTPVGHLDMGNNLAQIAKPVAFNLVLIPYDIVLSPTGVASTDTPAMDCAIGEALSEGRTLKLRSGTFRRTTELPLRTACGLRMEGVAKDTGTLGRGTLIECTTDSADLIGLGGFGHTLSDFTIRHANFSPTSTTGNGISFYKNAYSVIERVDIYNAFNLFHIPQADVQDLGSGSGTGNYGFFSNSFSDMGLHNYYNSGLWLHAYNGAMTGSDFNNIYLQNGTVGSYLTPAGNPVDIFVCDEITFNQLNIEDGVVGIGILLNQGQAEFNSLHFERINLTGWQPQYVRSYGSSQISINTMTVAYGDFAATGAGNYSSLFTVAAGGDLYARSIWIHECQKTGAIPWYIAQVDSGDTTSTNSIIVDTNPMVKSGSPAFTARSAPATTYANGLRRLGDAVYTPAPISVTTSQTLANASGVVALIGAGGAPQMPTAVGNTFPYRLKNVDTANHTISTTSSQTIDGSTTYVLTPNQAIDLYSDGSNWKVF